MKYHYSAGLMGIVLIILICSWFMAKLVALTTGHFALLFTVLALVNVSAFVFLYIRTFAARIFPEVEGIVIIGANAMYDSLISKVEKHSKLPQDKRKPFVYPQHMDNSHRGIIEYIPRFQHQRKQYLQHYHFIVEELEKPDCHYELVIEQIEELKALLD